MGLPPSTVEQEEGGREGGREELLSLLTALERDEEERRREGRKGRPHKKGFIFCPPSPLTLLHFVLSLLPFLPPL